MIYRRCSCSYEKSDGICTLIKINYMYSEISLKVRNLYIYDNEFMKLLGLGHSILKIGPCCSLVPGLLCSRLSDTNLYLNMRRLAATRALTSQEAMFASLCNNFVLYNLFLLNTIFKHLFWTLCQFCFFQNCTAKTKTISILY